MDYYRDAITGQLRRGPGIVLGRAVCGDSRFERACYWVGPWASRLGFRLWEWSSWIFRRR